MSIGSDSPTVEILCLSVILGVYKSSSSSVPTIVYKYCKMTPESRNSSLLGNGSVNTFLWKRTGARIKEWRFVWSSAAVNQHATIEAGVFSVRASPRLYNEDLRQLCD
jgi:hypothetical protein